MLNFLFSRINTVASGWDPVGEEHVARYAQAEWDLGADKALIGQLNDWLPGGLSGKTVLDLGGGPGQYAVALAKTGASVTWHDVSVRYMAIARRKADEHGVAIEFSHGYLDDAPHLLGRQFDLVFNRICWNYGRGDGSFAKVVYALVKPGGVGYVDANNSTFMFDSMSGSAKFRSWLNARFRWKIGHPFAPRGRIARLFASMPVEKMLIDHSAPVNDRVVFRKPRDPS
jgi:2-polyprenyl-3-methyl-5-hydroxy-6-metoxy-1,4-benzoquinol methylase